MISIANLQKVVAQRTELEIPGLTISAGEVAAVVGPSDSGTAVLRSLLTGQTRPTQGSVRIAGVDPAADPLAFSRTAGVLFAADALYSSRTPHANLAFHARLRGLPGRRVGEVLAQVGLADHGRASLSTLSSGMRRRLGLGISLLHEPPVLLLEEPFARCDEASIALIRRLITDHAAAGGAALLLAATDSYLDRLCHTIYELENGRIARERRPQEEADKAALPFKIPVKLEGRVALINPADILFVEVKEGRAWLQTADEKLPTQFTLSELEERLARSGFFRAHRSFLVNLQHVTEVIPYTRSSFSLRLDDPAGTKIPLSRDAARELRELLDY